MQQFTEKRDANVEALKRDIRLFIDRCQTIVSESKTAQLEAQSRNRFKEDTLLDLEYHIELNQQTIDNFKEENNILMEDCTRLLGEIEGKK